MLREKIVFGPCFHKVGSVLDIQNDSFPMPPEILSFLLQ